MKNILSTNPKQQKMQNRTEKTAYMMIKLKSQKNLKKLTKKRHAKQSKTKHQPLYLMAKKPEQEDQKQH